MPHTLKPAAATAMAQPAIDFNNSAIAFAFKSDNDLRLAYWLFRMVSHPSLVKAGGKLALWAVDMGLPVDTLIRKTLYRHFCGGENLYQAERVIDSLADHEVETVLDYAAESQQTEPGFDGVMGEILKNIHRARQNNHISCISLKMTGLGPAYILEKLQAKQALTVAEELSFDRTCKRLNRICKEVAASGITLFIDAEESWIQDPIDSLAEEMMARYNIGRAYIFNTLQMYRTDRLAYLQKLLTLTSNQPYFTGVKLVRGAYLEKEHQRAKELGYTSPVFNCKSATDQSFDAAVALTLQHLHHAELCAATHNEASTRKLVEQIEEGNLPLHDREKISFSQLYGMSDNLTYNLAQAGFRTSKYLPYGTVRTALPYLLRRAEENTSISGQMSRELQLIEKEMKRRKLK